MIANVAFYQGGLMSVIFQLLAQMDGQFTAGEPTLDGEYSFGFAWIIAAVVTALVLLVAFKTSKRTAMQRE